MSKPKPKMWTVFIQVGDGEDKFSNSTDVGWYEGVLSFTDCDGWAHKAHGNWHLIEEK